MEGQLECPSWLSELPVHSPSELKCFTALLFLRQHFHVWLERFFFLSDWGSQLYNSQRSPSNKAFCRYISLPACT